MAKHLARIHGTEEDRVNCPFWFKIGACRHSDRCSRLHHKPAFSQTLLFPHLYQHPLRQAELQQAAGGSNNNPMNAPKVDPEQATEDFLCFFEDMYMELSKFGRIEGVYVADNMGDHMIGHVYVKFTDEEEASDALDVMNGRYYDGRPMRVEFSPVTDFREARCRDYDEDACQRGGFCNFLHVKPVHPALLRSLEDDAEADRRQQQEQERRARKEKKRKRKDRDERHKKSRKHRRRSRSPESDEDDNRSYSASPQHSDTGEDNRESRNRK